MKNLFHHVLPTAIALIVVTVFAGQGVALAEADESNIVGDQASMKIQVIANSKTTVFELNNSQAAGDLYAQLPLSTKVEDYSDNEKIFYPPRKLNTIDAPQADARAGRLAYYAPWGDVVMFYDRSGSAPGLYELGHAVSGGEHIYGMTGSIMIEKVQNQ